MCEGASMKFPDLKNSTAPPVSWIRHWCYIIDNSPSFSECYDWQQTTHLKIKLTYLRAFNARFCLTTNLKIKLTYLRAFNARFCLTTNLKIKLTYLRAFNARFCLTTHLKIKLTYLRAFNARFCLTTNLKIKLTYLRAFNARFCFIPCWRATSHAAHRQETLKQRILNPSPSIQPGCPLSHIFSWYCHPRSFPFIFNVLPHISVILNLSKVISKEIYHFFFYSIWVHKFPNAIIIVGTPLLIPSDY